MDLTATIATGAPIYTSRIIKASALLADTKALLHAWDLNASVEGNLARVKQANIFGKASRSRIEDILVIFRQRYFDDADVGAMLVTLASHPAGARWLDPLLYFFSAQNDRVLRDFVVDVLFPRSAAGFTDVDVNYVIYTLRQWVAEGKTTKPWGDATVERVAQGILATLRDFGVLRGAAKKQLAPVYLDPEPFALVAFWLQQQVRAGAAVVHSDEWRLFFLPVTGVERFLVEAHQHHLLNYLAAGAVVRIDYPASTLTEYAHVLLEGAR